MAYGVNTTGFNLKRFEDIKLEIETTLRESFGEIDTDADSVFGQIIGVFSRALAEIWEQSENIYNSMYPSTAEGISLDNSCSYVGIKRLAATASTAIVHLKATNGTVVPPATRFLQSLLGSSFDTVESVTVSLSFLHKVVITVDPLVDNFDYIVTINGSTSLYFSGPSATKDDIAEGLKLAVNANTNINTKVTAYHVSGDDFLTIITSVFTIEEIFIAALSANLVASEIWSPVNTNCIVAGATPAPINSIDTIVTPVFGLDSVLNMVDGITGRNLETDAELRIRRRNSLNIIASGTLNAILSHIIQDIPEVSAAFIFENATDLEDAFGRPPHSFELIVAAVDTTAVNLKIANKLWERKPAGIATFGTTAISVKDSNNKDQDVRFSRVVYKYAFFLMNCNTAGADQPFPSNGKDLIKAEILRLGGLLTFGSDFLIQVFAAAGYAAGGVTTVTLQIGIGDDPNVFPTMYNTNLTINPNELLVFAAHRIVITVV